MEIVEKNKKWHISVISEPGEMKDVYEIGGGIIKWGCEEGKKNIF